MAATHGCSLVAYFLAHHVYAGWANKSGDLLRTWPTKIHPPPAGPKSFCTFSAPWPPSSTFVLSPIVALGGGMVLLLGL